MTTLDDATKKRAEPPSAEAASAAELVKLTNEQDLSLTGPDGLLKQFTKTVLETALNEEKKPPWEQPCTAPKRQRYSTSSSTICTASTPTTSTACAQP